MALTKVTGAGVGNLDELGVGTASPSYKVHSVTTSGSDYAGFFHNSAGSGNGTALVVKGGANNTGAGTFIVQDYGGNTDLMVDGNGHVTMPYQPKFLVRKNAHQSNISNNGSTNTTVTWETEVYDIGSNFGSNVFTAPVDGYYFLATGLRTDNIDTGADHYTVRLEHSNGEFRTLFDPDVFATDATYWHIHVSGVGHMDAGDTAGVVIVQDGGDSQTDVREDTYRTFFCGHLLS